jgi:hypothetical protein
VGDCAQFRNAPSLNYPTHPLVMAILFHLVMAILFHLIPDPKCVHRVLPQVLQDMGLKKELFRDVIMFNLVWACAHIIVCNPLCL